MSAVKNSDLISVKDYLKGELIAENKHEFIDGQVYAMVGGSDNHDRISGNVYAEFRNHLMNQES